MLANCGSFSITNSSQNLINLVPASVFSSVHQVLLRRRLTSRNKGHLSSSNKERACAESMNQTLKELEKSGFVRSWVSQCREELLMTTKRNNNVWHLDSHVSKDTFLENIKNGFGKVDIKPELSAAVMSFEQPNSFFQQMLFKKHPHSVQLHLARNFKSRRYSPDGDFPFRKDPKDPSEESDTLNSKSNGEQNSPFNELLRNSDLSKDDQKRIAAALHGYSLGLKNGINERAGISGDEKAKSPTGFFSSLRTTGKVDQTVLSPNPTPKNFNFWEKVNKMASILVIIAIIISLAQIFNVPILRINRGNEISPDEIEVTFDDVRGCDEAKKELQEIVDFLMNPEKFSALGGKLPKGVLLVGPPGTGKTLLARAVAGQAGVPFFHASGSEFDEVLVGQGAKRIRDLFKSAKARAPCVVFIDEIDTVGSKRTSSVLHPYANQTINQLLSEMDGFVANEGVIVLGATNRAEELDKALLRPGRFDTQVTVPKPDMNGRLEILNLYMSKIKHDSSIDIQKLAKMTVGFSGADLENMVNTSAIRAAVEGKPFVTMSEFEYSHDKHVLGTDWKSRVRDKEDLKITAYHEAGHTLVAFFTENAQPLHKVTIVAKGMSGGHTAFLPEKDTYHDTKAQYLASMDVSMGGRAAEEMIFGKDKVTGGASSDLQSATMIAEAMVKELGMSDKIGLRVIRANHNYSDIAPGTVELIDTEVNRIMSESYKRAMSILKSHKPELDLLAEALLNYETLDVEDVKAILEGEKDKVFSKLKKEQLNSLNQKIFLEEQSKAKSGGVGSSKKPGGEVLVQ